MYHAYAEALRATFLPMIPEMILVVFACILYLGGTQHGSRRLWGTIALAGLGASLVAVLLFPHLAHVQANIVILNKHSDGVPFLFDSLSQITRILAIVGGAAIVLLSWRELSARHTADHHACLLIIVAGTGLVGAANDLVAMFLVLELISIPTYILLYLPRHDEPAQEAAVKYFLLSILSSALLLFGFSYLYGLAGTTNISGILEVFLRQLTSETHAHLHSVSGMTSLALIMIVAAVGFRITAVPFHFYAPDVYQGTSTSGAAMLAFIPKVAGFAALLRLLGFVLPAELVLDIQKMTPAQQQNFHPGMLLSQQVPILFWFLAGFTMTIGNLFGLLQDNVKRLLAYSSIAHAGYMLVALASAPYLLGQGNINGTTPLLFYLIAYGAMTIGVFTVLAMLSTPERRIETVDDLAGLAQSHPGTALMLVVILLSLIGIPLTAGFTGKLFVFLSAVNVSEAPKLFYLLALIGFLNAAIGGWYYLRLITVMYLRSSIKPITTPGSIQGRILLASCVVLTLGLSMPPMSHWILDAARKTSPQLNAAVPAEPVAKQ